MTCWRIRFNSVSSNASFTRFVQFRGLSKGQGRTGGFSMRLSRWCKLDHGHRWASVTNLARSGLASTYRHNARKYESSSTQKCL